MSSGVKGAVRVSIPGNVKKMIENIKEITGQNHGDDEIYAMLKECSMDPNETAQKLLLLDTFHEVRRKRDRRKENLNKEPTELKWKSGTQTRANKGNRGNYSSRYASHDADAGKSSAAAKEIATGHVSVKGVSKVPSATALEMKRSDTTFVMSQITAVSNGPPGITSDGSRDYHASAVWNVEQSEATVDDGMKKLDGPLQILSPAETNRKAISAESGDMHRDQVMDLKNNSMSVASESAGASYSCSADTLPSPSPDLRILSTGSSIKRDMGSLSTPVEAITDIPSEINSVSAKISVAEAGSSISLGKFPNELHVAGKNHHLDFTHTVVSTNGVLSVSRPVSNYNNRSQVIGVQKNMNHGVVKEWKPKPQCSSISQGSIAAVSSVVSSVPIISYPESQPTPIAPASEKATLDLQKKLEESHISDTQHVIIPNHLHVPETEKLWFCFGSFDANFNINKSHDGELVSDQSQPLPESYEDIDASMKELPLSVSDQHDLIDVKDLEVKHSDRPQSPPEAPAKFSSSDGEVPSSIIPDYVESKQDVAPGGHQLPADNAPNYNFGFMPPVLGGQHFPLESLEAQVRDAPRLPGFVQSFDPSSYYAQFYRSSMDGDGRISPFHPVVASNKHMGNPAMISAQTSQSPQELQGPIVLSNSPTPLMTQAAGVMQSSITGTQQPLPVFRQPTGVHLPHYPPSYIPYAPPYFSPFYAPPQAILQFLSSNAFPQQPQAGSMFPTPPGTTAKYSVSQNKQGSNSGSSTQIAIPGSYGPYGLSAANYTSSSATAVSSTANEDLSAAQIKENNMYAGGQQASSFYNFPQGQLAFGPTQPGHGTFTGMFHPAQAVTAATVHPSLLQQSQAITNPIDMVGPTSHVYQQPQHAQLNWPSNY